MTTAKITHQRSALQREQAHLLARLAEIEAELADLELADAVQEVLDSTPGGAQGQRSGNGEHGHGGHWIETRLVNGCGPYAYERWWDGGKKRSKYLGKAVTQQ